MKKNILLTILLCINISILFLYAYIHILNVDEREHLYASFMVHNGYLPYRDFFEHHHPLLWYLFAPLLYFCDNTPNIWYIIRSFGLAVILGCAYYVYQITRLIANNTITSIIALLFYFSFNIVLIYGTEFRPDNLMILCFLAGLYYFLKYQKEQKLPLLAISYTLFFLSFFALQKILFLLMAVAVVILYSAIKNKTLRKQLLLTATLPLGLTLLYIGYLYHNHTLKDYFELNWLIYLHFSVQYTLIKWHSYIMPLIGVACVFLPNSFKNSDLNIIKFLFLIEICSQLFTATSPHYLLTLYPFLAIILATTVSRIKQPFQNLILSLFIIPALISFYNIYYYPKVHLYRTAYLSNITLSNTNKGDLIIPDMLWVGGLRKSALGYYWFGLERTARLDYNIFHRHEFPDINLIIRTRNPKLITTNTIIFNCLNDKNQITRDCSIEQTIDFESLKFNYMKSDLMYIRLD